MRSVIRNAEARMAGAMVPMNSRVPNPFRCPASRKLLMRLAPNILLWAGVMANEWGRDHRYVSSGGQERAFLDIKTNMATA